MINRQNKTHIEYCRHINLYFSVLPESEYEELITVQHHTSLIGSTQKLLSLEAPKLDEEVTTEKNPPIETTTNATTLTPIVENTAGPEDSIVSTFTKGRRRRSLNACEDACYEVSLVHFEISFDLKASNFKIKNDDILIFNKPVKFSEILIDPNTYDRNTGSYRMFEEIEIYFHPNDNFFADVAKIRYESIQAQYSSLPKRNNKSH